MTALDMKEVRRLLGMGEDTSDTDARARLVAARDALELHARLAQDLHLNAGASGEQIVVGLQRAQDDVIAHMREQLVSLGDEMKSLRLEAARSAAEQFVNTNAEKRVITLPAREIMIELHMQSPEKAQAMLESMPLFPDSSRLLNIQGGKSPKVPTGMEREINERMA